MIILVDKIPEYPRECLFSLVSISGEYCNCKLKMQDEYDLVSPSFNGGCYCNLSRGKECPYLKCLLDHFGGKKTYPEIDYKIVEETRKKLYNSLGVPEELIDQGTLSTATKISMYEEEKFKKHFRESIDAAINSCYREPSSWDDFVSNSPPKNDDKYFI